MVDFAPGSVSAAGGLPGLMSIVEEDGDVGAEDDDGQ
jgi:hypothetical protein